MIEFLPKPDERELKAFVNLRMVGDFQVFQKWLEKSRQEALELFPKIEEEKDLTRLSGGVRVVSEILRTIDESSKALDAVGK